MATAKLAGANHVPGAGDLRNRLRFEERGLDANGDRLGPWGEVCTVWAQVKWLRGSESAVNSRLEGKKPAAVVVRSSSKSREFSEGLRAVAVSGRDVIAGQQFNISAVSPAKEPGFIDILAVVGGATG